MSLSLIMHAGVHPRLWHSLPVFLVACVTSDQWGVFITNSFQAEHRYQIRCQGTVTWKWGEQRERKREREREGDWPTSFYSFPGAHLLCKTDFCRCFGHVQSALWRSPGRESGVGVHTAALNTSLKAEKEVGSAQRFSISAAPSLPITTFLLQQSECLR